MVIKILDILVIEVHSDFVLGTSEVMLPVLEWSDDRQHFVVVDIIVDFGVY